MDRERALALHCAERFRTAGTLEEYLELYGEEAVLWGYGPGPLRGKGAIRAFYRGILEAFADIRLRFDDVLADESRQCLTLRFHMECRHVGPFMGFAATDRPGLLHGITILRFGGGRCVGRWSTADFLGLLVQLGALAPGGGQG